MHNICVKQENKTCFKQSQQLLINLAMKQAFHVMQMPVLELADWLQKEIETNPVLEIDLTKEDFKESLDVPLKKTRDKTQEKADQKRHEQRENLLPARVSLFEYLMQQAPLHFDTPEDLILAELIIGHLDEKGFLAVHFFDIAPEVPEEKMEQILKTIQTFDPPGISARGVQESLLIQLKLKEKENTLGFRILYYHYEDLLHNRHPVIAKSLHISMQDLSKVISEEIAILDPHPGYKFATIPLGTIVPDLILHEVDGKWNIEINTSYLPHFFVAPHYLNMLNEPTIERAESSYIRKHLAGGQWLKKTVLRRNQTLEKIAKCLLKTQGGFFEGEQRSLTPLTMKDVAEELGLNESTIARAVANKFLACPQGLFPLKSFFTQSVVAENGQKLSRHTLRQMLHRMVDSENKQDPLSDEEIAVQFRKVGIPFARRTVSKYRQTLHIASAAKRRKWK